MRRHRPQLGNPLRRIHCVHGYLANHYRRKNTEKLTRSSSFNYDLDENPDTSILTTDIRSSYTDINNLSLIPSTCMPTLRKSARKPMASNAARRRQNDVQCDLGSSLAMRMLLYDNFRISLSQLRMSSHRLYIETGRNWKMA